MKFFGDFINKVICGDCLEIIKKMPNGSVDMIMTSPPYYGLRDYGFEQIFGGDPGCKHTWSNSQIEHDNLRYRGHKANVGSNKNPKIHPGKKGSGGQDCIYCGAWKGQLGLEPTPEMYIEHLAEMFSEAKRVLKKEGTLWLNIGDTYGGSGQGSQTGYGDYKRQKVIGTMEKSITTKIMPKCLLMIPERLAWSLIQNGWILRNKIIWFKPNSMPASVKDRFSNRWEFLFMFSKNQKYYFDLDAVREPHHLDSIARKKRGVGPDHKYADKHGYGGGGGLNKPRISLKDKRKGLVVPGQLPHGIHRKRHSGYFGENGGYLVNPLGKNPGDIIIVGAETRTMGAIIGSGGGVKVPGGKGWTGHPKGGGAACEKDPRWSPQKGRNPGDFQEISTQPFPEAHFAVFPEKLCEKPIKAGCPEEVCKKCGKARERIVEKGGKVLSALDGRKGKPSESQQGRQTEEMKGSYGRSFPKYETETIGWTSCKCKAGFEPGIVLDPFAGAGTVLYVAKQLRRRFIGIDIKKEYCNLCEKRLAQGVL